MRPSPLAAVPRTGAARADRPSADAREYLQNDRGFSEAEAVELAVRMLGDPDALGRSLRHARFPPRYLCCLIATGLVWAAIAACAVYLLLQLQI